MSTPHRPLHQIARDIRNAWQKPYFGAVHYLDAMSTLDQITDMYYQDSARAIVLYFLANASSFKGERAKELKDELKQIAGLKK